jgi:predicted lipid carrier protein YhbT
MWYLSIRQVGSVVIANAVKPSLSVAAVLRVANAARERLRELQHPRECPEGVQTVADVKPYLQRMVDRFALPGVQASLKGFTKTLQFKFTDTNEAWLIRAVDGKEATLTQETLEKPDITIVTSTDILAGIMDKKINGTTAFMQRKIQTKGPMEDLMKLQKLML